MAGQENNRDTVPLTFHHKGDKNGTRSWNIDEMELITCSPLYKINVVGFFTKH